MQHLVLSAPLSFSLARWMKCFSLSLTIGYPFSFSPFSPHSLRPCTLLLCERVRYNERRSKMSEKGVIGSADWWKAVLAPVHSLSLAQSLSFPNTISLSASSTSEFPTLFPISKYLVLHFQYYLCSLFATDLRNLAPNQGAGTNEILDYISWRRNEGRI